MTTGAITQECCPSKSPTSPEDRDACSALLLRLPVKAPRRASRQIPGAFSFLAACYVREPAPLQVACAGCCGVRLLALSLPATLEVPPSAVVIKHPACQNGFLTQPAGARAWARCRNA